MFGRCCAGCAAARAKVGWRAAVDSLRPHSHALWQGLDADEQRRFLRHARPWWDVHRHRIAPEVARDGRADGRRGRLEIVAGRIISAATTADDGIEVEYRRRGAQRIAARALRLCVQLHRPAALDRADARPAAPQPARRRSGASPTISASAWRSTRTCRAGRASMGDGAADQGPLLGDHRGAGYSRAGGRRSRTILQQELGG